MIAVSTLISHLQKQGQRFGLLSQQSSPVAGLVANNLPRQFKAIFSAEHGFFAQGAAGEKVASQVHPDWHVPIHSLYGQTRKPTPEMLEGLERIVIDLQDIGVRCYTYLATLKLMLEAAAEAHLPVTVLDRPIPLGGILDGPMREVEYASFVAPLNIPLCHGMTPGEAAKYIVRQQQLDVDLTVIRMPGWSHSKRAPWMNFVPPSPAIKSWDSAALYPLSVFTEAFPAIDCDRSGPLAFRVLGAKWLDTATVLNDLADVVVACGVSVRPYRYRTASGTPLNGLLFEVANPDAFYPVTAGIVALAAILGRHPEEATAGMREDWMAKLYGSQRVLDAMLQDSLSKMFQGWIIAQDEYLPKRVNLYPTK